MHLFCSVCFIHLVALSFKVFCMPQPGNNESEIMIETYNIYHFMTACL